MELFHGLNICTKNDYHTNHRWPFISRYLHPICVGPVADQEKQEKLEGCRQNFGSSAPLIIYSNQIQKTMNLTILFIIVCAPLALGILASIFGKNNPGISGINQDELDHHDRMNNL